MSKYIFELKRPIIVPAPINNAFLIFPKNKCSLSYEILPKPKVSTMTIILTIVDNDNNNILMQLAEFNITEQGFSSGIFSNQTTIDDWNTSYTPLATALLEKQTTFYALQTEALQLSATKQPIPQELLDQMTVLDGEINEITANITNLGPKPIGQEIFINKYSDVIQYFDNKGAITEAGIEWAKNIPFLGFTIGDYIL